MTRTDPYRADLAFAAALGALPFLGYVRAQPMPGFWGEWLAVAVVLLWLAVAGQPGRGWRAGAPFLAVASVMLLHLAARLVPMPIEVLVAAAVLVVAAVLAAHASAPERAGPIATGLGFGLVAALLLNAVAVGLERFGWEWQLIALHPIEPPPRSAGLVGQSNHLATLAVLGVAAAACLRQAGQLPRWALWGVTLAAAGVLAASSSRAGMVVAAAVLPLLAFATRRAIPRGEWIGLLLVFVAIQLAWVFAPAGELPAGAAVAGGERLIARSDAGRSSIWLDALALWRAHPLLGVGHGNFAQARLHELSGPMLAPNVDHAHNLVLQVASEWGLAGLVVVAVTLAWLARAGWRVLRAPTPDRLFGLAVLVGLLVHGLAEHPLWFPHYLFVFAVAVGLVVGRSEPADRAPAAPRSRAVQVFAVVAALAVSAVAALDYQRLHRIATGLRADAHRPAGTPPQVRLADVAEVERLTLFPRPATLLLSAVLPINPTAVDAKLAVARRAMDMIPADQTVARWALLAVLAGRADEAQALLVAMRTRNPGLYAGALALMQRSTFGNAALAAFVAGLPPP